MTIKTFKLSCLLLSVCVGLLFFLPSCGGPRKGRTSSPAYSAPYKIGRHWYYPVKSSRGFRQRGTASWYGKECHGQKTSNGETYNMYALTAAHKTLPMGTYVKVHNLNSRKEVVVRINDRGPFVRGRIIDLSYAAAREIGLVGPGTAPVKILALGKPRQPRVKGKVRRTFVPEDYNVGDYTIQVGAFRDKKNAFRLKKKLAQTYKNAHIAVHESSGGTLYRVRVARCTTLGQARKYEKMLEAAGYPDAVVVAR